MGSLRLTDSASLRGAAGGAAALQPCFVFDAAEVRAGGPRRAAFVREAVCALRGALAERESSLAVREGRPEDVLAALCEATGATAVYAAAGTSYEALELEARVRRALAAVGATLELAWDATLHAPDALPFEGGIEGLPSSFPQFREAADRMAPPPAPLPPPERMPPLPRAVRGHGDAWRRGRGGVAPNKVPSLRSLGAQAFCDAPPVGGGEPTALARLREALTAGMAGAMVDSAQLQQSTGMGGNAEESTSEHRTRAKSLCQPPAALTGADFSVRLSPWLATGCVSARRVLTEACESGMLRSAEAEGLRFELLWRDYFALVTHKFALRQMREAGVPEAASSF